LKRTINVDGSVIVEEKGVHSNHDALKTKKRGFTGIIQNDIIADLNSGKSPKRIALNHSAASTNSLEFKKSKKSIANLKYRLKKKKDNIYGMNYLNDISEFINANIVTTREVFDAKGNTIVIMLTSCFNICCRG
jgi:hypothetical protein